jgi:hypothetical protein
MQGNERGQTHKMSKIHADAWRSVDWSQTTAQIAVELGVTSARVSQVRKKLSPETFNRVTQGQRLDWTGVDWQRMTNRTIAEVLGTSANTISSYRRRYAPDTARKPRGVNWSLVDWSRTNRQIMDSTGAGASTVKAARRAYDHTFRLKGRRIPWTDVDWTKDSMEIAEDLGVSSASVRSNRRRFAPHTIIQDRRVIAWECVDWSRRTTDIAKDFGLPLQDVSAARRMYAPSTLRPTSARSSTPPPQANRKDFMNPVSSPKKGPGRPADHNAGMTADSVIHIKVPKGIKNDCVRRAQREGKTLSAWMVEAALERLAK